MSRTLHLIDADTPLAMRDQLALLAEEGDRIVSVGPPPATEDRIAAEVVHAPLISATLASVGLRSLAEDIDIFHAWSNVAHRLAYRLAGRRRRPLIRSLATVTPDLSAAVVARRMATLWLAPTEHARQRLIRRSVPPERVDVIAPAAQPPTDAARRRTACRDELGLGDDGFLIAACGEMLRSSGHKMASWVHAILRYIHPQVQLLFCDGGPSRESVFHFAGGTGFAEGIHGPWPPSRRPDLLSAADAAMVCDHGPGGAGALAGALAAGLPTVLYPVGDLVECAGDAALVARPATPRAAAQAMLKILEDPSLRAQLSQAAGRRATECFSVAAAKPRLRQAYHRATELTA